MKTVRFIYPEGIFCKEIRLCRTSAKGEPAKSRWVPHLDASDFPKIRPCLSSRINSSRIYNVDSANMPNSEHRRFILIILYQEPFVNEMAGEFLRV